MKRRALCLLLALASSCLAQDLPPQGGGGSSVDSDALDNAFGSTRGAILYRGASGWTSLAPGATAGQPLIDGGTGADPSWGTVGFDASGLSFASDQGIMFSSTTSFDGPKDVGLARSAAGVLEVTDGSTGLGGIKIGNGDNSAANPQFKIGNDTSGIFSGVDGWFRISSNGTEKYRYRPDQDLGEFYHPLKAESYTTTSGSILQDVGVSLDDDGYVRWSDTDGNPSATQELRIGKLAAGVAAVYGGTGTAEPGAIMHSVLTEDVTATSNALLGTESAKLATNIGAVGTVTHTLPTGAAGLTYTFLRSASQAVRVDPATGDKFILLGQTFSDGEYVELATDNVFMKIVCLSNGDWLITDYSGTWDTDITEETP